MGVGVLKVCGTLARRVSALIQLALAPLELWPLWSAVPLDLTPSEL